MKIREFTYKKSSGEETDREILVFQEGEKYLEGIDLAHLTPNEKKDLLDKAAEFDAAIKPYVNKAYRRFNIDSITSK